jgi:hypothetical protein
MDDKPSTAPLVLPVPDERDWGDPDRDDLDRQWARKVFLGRNMDECAPLFAENPIERCDEIRFMRPVPFRYYLTAFARWVAGSEALRYGAPDAASCFLRLVLEKLEESPSPVAPILPEIVEAARFVADNQAGYGADVKIYGDFREIFARIEGLARPWL